MLDIAITVTFGMAIPWGHPRQLSGTAFTLFIDVARDLEKAILRGEISLLHNDKSQMRSTREGLP